MRIGHYSKVLPSEMYLFFIFSEAMSDYCGFRSSQLFFLFFFSGISKAVGDLNKCDCDHYLALHSFYILLQP